MTDKKFVPGKHILVLDGIRGLAILLVMIQHFFQEGQNPQNAIDSAIYSIAGRFWAGVDLFFVLSGFLITGILFDAKKKQNYFKNFYARRFFRIFPLYYFVLFVFFVVFPRLPLESTQEYIKASIDDQWWFWAYLGNFCIAGRGEWYPGLIPNVLWSLAIEEQFYLVWPIVVLCFKRETLMKVCIALVFTAILVRFVMTAQGYTVISKFVFTPSRMDGLVIGAFIALLARGPRSLPEFKRYAWLAIVAGFGLIGLVAVTSGMAGSWPAYVYTFRLSAFTVMFGGLLVLSLVAPTGSPLKWFFESSFMRMLGKYSYAMYLFHGPVDHFSKYLFDPRLGEPIAGSAMPRTLTHFVIASVITLVLSILSWNLLEKHCLKLKDRFQNAPPAS